MAWHVQTVCLYSVLQLREFYFTTTTTENQDGVGENAAAIFPMAGSNDTGGGSVFCVYIQSLAKSQGAFLVLAYCKYAQ